MSYEWKWLRNPAGTPQTVKTTVGAAAVTKGQPLKIASNLAVAADDGNTVDLVAAHDADASAVLVGIVPNGDVFEVTTGADLGMHDRAYMASGNLVDAGSSGNISNIVVVDYNPASGGLAHIQVWANPMSAYTHTG
jgi:hypothetical protein